MWINCKDKMPEDMAVVIALYLGCWPGRGNSGITDIYAFDGEWFNLPEGVLIVGWMPIPDTAHLPIAEHYKGLKIDLALGNFLGCVETDAPEIFEGVFEGDSSKIKRS
jgi:hypothetical protein